MGLLSSRKRGNTVKELLMGMGFSSLDVSLIRNPVGLDISAKTPAEVAVSILAEIVQAKPKAQPLEMPELRLGLELPTVQPRVATDPICGMEVEIASAKQVAEYEGQNYYFCCPHCKAKFLKEPQKYLVQANGW